MTDEDREAQAIIDSIFDKDEDEFAETVITFFVLILAFPLVWCLLERFA